VTGVDATPDAVRAAAMQDEKPGGHGERAVAVAVLELAAWDLAGKLEEVPVRDLISRRFTRQAGPISLPVYAAGGYYHAGGETAVADEMRGYLDAGYTHVKMKIGGAPIPDDVGRVEAVLRLLPDGSHLAVDANGRLHADLAMAYVDALAPFGLRWFEEPGDPLDFDLLSALVSDGRMTYATGENLFSIEEVRNLVRYGGLRPERDVVEVDPALAYGILEYAQVVGALEAAGWPAAGIVPHGGHLISLNVAAGFGLGGCEAYPREFAPFGGFGPAVEIGGGRATLPDAPGFALETKPDLAPILERLVA
jgi:L-alanine-DL-glutamate epimerase-like enolase superfamily enzyme